MTVAELKRVLEQLPDDMLVLTRTINFEGDYEEAEAVHELLKAIDGLTWTRYANTVEKTEKVLLII